MTLKLSYFDLRSRAETSRLVLHAAKKKFEDNRIPFSEWSKVKPTTPFGSLPVLEVDGQTYAQGIAIATYLAMENGLFGSNNLEALEINQLHLLREDLIVEEVKVFQVKDPEKKNELVDNMNKNVYPRFLNYFNKILLNNQEKNKTNFTVGTKLSLADIIIFEGIQNVVQTNPQLLDNYPALKALRATVAEVDGIKQYLATRKQTDL
ncbi:probable glutathione S-transferase 7 [Physella acuta]|uniref:probable glutathione S-transferase 7 n=1 Tax=Physella acuta TaxID=109671 RepID=UPI0027DB9196|nr:probable glutathione S-transferase 7 [Physella acuta]